MAVTEFTACIIASIVYLVLLAVFNRKKAAERGNNHGKRP